LKKSRFLDWTLPSWDSVGRYCHKLRERNYERSWTQSFFVMVLLHLIDTHWKREKRNPVESNLRNWWSFVKQKGNNVNLLQYQVVEGLGQLLGMCVCVCVCEVILWTRNESIMIQLAICDPTSTSQISKNNNVRLSYFYNRFQQLVKLWKEFQKLILSYLVHSQIWLNVLMDDHQFKCSLAECLQKWLVFTFLYDFTARNLQKVW
jgi:hypothetical protein